MQSYRVIVRDYNYNRSQPSDEYLFALDRYYVSPVVKLGMEADWDQALTNFDKEYGENYSHFRYPNFELIPFNENWQK